MFKKFEWLFAENVNVFKILFVFIKFEKIICQN